MVVNPDQQPDVKVSFCCYLLDAELAQKSAHSPLKGDPPMGFWPSMVIFCTSGHDLWRDCLSSCSKVRIVCFGVGESS